MKEAESRNDLSEAAWAHIDAERFDEAETALRKLIEQIHPEDSLRLWHYFGLLAGVLNGLGRFDEGTEAEATPVPPGMGHVQCLLHAITAQALWKLERRDEARAAARNAIAACPTVDRRTQLSEQLDFILVTG